MNPHSFLLSIDSSSSSSPSLERIKSYIQSLQTKIQELGGTFEDDYVHVDPTESMMQEEEDDDDDDNKDTDTFEVPQYSTGEDYEKQSELKQKATDAKNDGHYEESLSFFNEAVQAAPPSALLYANRAMVLEKLGHYKAAENDCKVRKE